MKNFLKREKLKNKLNLKKDLWGQRICDPDPLYIRAQDPSRGEALPRTYNESPNCLETQPRMILSSASHSAPKRKSEHSAGAAQVKGCQYYNKALCT